MSEQQQIIEHIVLFKVKPDADPTKLAAMFTGLNNLSSLNLTLHLTFGQLLQSRSASPLTFTHMLHSRYKSKLDLHSYTVHPEHIRVVNENKPIIDDVMAVDWISNGASVSLKPGSAMRVTFLKVKEDLGENEKARVLEVIGGIKEEIEAIEELSFGENFSHERAKGYTIGSIVVLDDLEALELKSEIVDMQMEKIGDWIESAVVVDYVIPSL